MVVGTEFNQVVDRWLMFSELIFCNLDVVISDCLGEVSLGLVMVYSGVYHSLDHVHSYTSCYEISY